ncbi:MULTISPECIES: 50S ribosomal protein L1 [Acidiplasma]|jgi:large subunit ribosomal protein L1|uniref:Large ribosomal subunit protein uL1 n=2 Tax=Acidiplasma TaxID=507753 RepID=A0A0Q1B1N2_9ARCH|nr:MULTISPECIES: 50S ribosomal protein L1 [Acidiplasma]KJE48801.1 50S ribosomal protein L1 [Acidiplasma sp. MBA-1]KPV46724.1 50S ribosomal protein L1 [Acidiplasma aeolicum]KQB33686.1 50S ribosomal protein L1 [Acidiplasma cupricumulans]KQB36528.1 50S ribosomal protein L1 [Acidiplasma aeolicum]WMT54188.1 MAG: 50S ribosomal protein L1 [Acidiplasma sp.]
MAGGVIKSIQEAKQGKERKFKESLELAFNLKDVDMSDPKNRINEEIILPGGRGKDIKVALIASDEMRLKAQNADYKYSLEDLNNFIDDKKAFKKLVNKIDFFVAESTMMGSIGKSLGIILGPRGKMPKPVPPGQDPTQLIENLKKSVRARSRDKRTFHVPIGVKDMPDDVISQNLNAVVKRVISHLEKGKSNLASVYIKSTMGKAVNIDLGDIE